LKEWEKDGEVIFIKRRGAARDSCRKRNSIAPFVGRSLRWQKSNWFENFVINAGSKR
jgi:hypothetical protein